MSGGGGCDWLRKYMRYTEELESPDLFHYWAGVFALSAALRRRVWLDVQYKRIYPNHYIILVAESATCKKSTSLGIAMGLVEEALAMVDDELREDCAYTELMRAKVTDADLWRALSAGKNASAILYVDELATLLGDESNGRIMDTLTRFYECPDRESKKTKESGRFRVEGGCIVLGAATTPRDLAELFPKKSTATGFTARLHFVYQTEPRWKNAFPEFSQRVREELVVGLRRILNLEGGFTFAEEARDRFQEWYEGELKEPDNEDVGSFYARSHTHVLKLAVVLSASRGNSKRVEVRDIDGALEELRKLQERLPAVYAEIGKDPDLRHRNRILRQIRKAGGTVTKSQVMRNNWDYMKRETVMEVLQYLEEAGTLETPTVVGKNVIYKLRKRGEE